MGNKRGIVILGMHRSGTSLLAEVAHRWGAYAGEADDIMEGNEWNPRGYWEYWPLVRFNETLLDSLDASWIAPPASGEAAARKAALPEMRDKAFRLIDEMEEGGRIWVWKDPRLTAVLPFWKEIWRDVVYIVPIRHPRDIAGSLAKRDDLPLTGGLQLWQASCLAILDFVDQEKDVLFVEYEKFLGDPAASCRALADYLDDKFGREPRTAEEVELIAGAVRGDLRNQKSAGDFNDLPEASQAQKDLFAFLRSRCGKTHEGSAGAGDFPLFVGWRDYLKSLERLRRRGARLATREHELRKLKRSSTYRVGRFMTWPYRLLFRKK